MSANTISKISCLARAGAGLLCVSCVIGIATSPQTSTMPPVVVIPNGSTSIEIQAALDNLPDVGGTVVLPTGITHLATPIVLRRSNQTLTGNSLTWLVLDTAANCPAIILGEPVNNPTVTLTNLTVSNLKIDGRKNEQTRENWKIRGTGSAVRNNGITVQAVSDSVISNVYCMRCRSGGLVTTLGVKRLRVQEFAAYDNQFDGLACYLTTDSSFSDLYLYDNPCAGISVDLAFNNNLVENARLDANDLGIFMRASHGNEFHNINVSNSKNHGLFMAHSDAKAVSSACTSNNFFGFVARACGGAAVWVNNLTCTNNLFVRPIFSGNAKGGLKEPSEGLVVVR